MIRTTPRAVFATVRPVLALRVTCCAAALAVAGCGSSSGGGGVNAPKIGAARSFQLQGFQPSRPVDADTPTRVAFDIEQPSGKPLTAYKTGSGPHTGVHLIMVRDDLSAIIHLHPPIGAGGKIDQAVTFPTPGRWHVLVDAYPNLRGLQPNFQLADTIDVAGHYAPKRIPPFRSTQTVDGYKIAIQGTPHIKAIQAKFLTIHVTDPSGRAARFTPWYGALAHAIFFRAKSLDYFHTHVCGPGAPNCTSTLGAAKVTGQSDTPGRLRVGILLPESGTWRLFLQLKAQGHVLTAPYTLKVA
jgi:hypothetical protein